MAQVGVRVVDAADVRAYDCLLPDDAPVSTVASRLAQLLHLPLVGPDGLPLSYGFVMKSGGLLHPESSLAEMHLPPEPVTLRLVPEFVVGVDTEDPPAHSELVEGLDRAGHDQLEHTSVHITAQIDLVHDAELDLRPDVRIDARVRKEIEHYAGKDRHTECLGLLFGTVSTEQDRRVIHVRAFAPAIGAVGTRTSVRVTLEAWESMLCVRDRDYPELRVLGWFHSHAGWGVFMSDLDVFVHRHFFPHPNMVAYVLDPTVGRDGFFHWHHGHTWPEQGRRISLLPSYAVVGAPSGAGRSGAMSCRAPSRTARRRKIDLRSAAIAALVGAAMYFGFTRPTTVPDSGHSPVASKSRPSQASALHPQPSTSVTAPPQSPQPPDRVYVVRDGDNLWAISKRTYGDATLAEELATYNSLADVAALQIDQRIKLPPEQVLRAMVAGN